ncbi:MAG: serine/threonine-protein kinase [Proteobacteria bacterium]|nr:serine/threonine-protein kinase [Pseudomonadota bacterium]
MTRRDNDQPTVDLGRRVIVDDPELDHGDHDGAGDHGADLGPDDAAMDTRTVGPDPVHSLPTQQIPLRGKAGKTAASMTRYSTTTSPVQAMKLDEVARTRVFLKVAIFLCIGGIATALISGGDAIARTVVIVGSVVAAFGAVVMLWVTRDAERYTARALVVPAFAVVFGSMAGVYYWGVASPVTAMLVYGIYFFSLGSNRGVTALMYGIVSIAHALLGLAIMAGVIVDRGLVAMSGLRTIDQVNLMVIIEALYLITFVTARKSQRVTLDQMEKLEQAVRGVAQREAMLAEARAELDRALKVGGPGRYTEQVVGSYRLGMLIGRGGMGEVYEAHGTADQREAAVKLLHAGTLGDPTSVARFLREAKTAASLDTPHVVRVLEVGTTASEIPFLAMERLRGFDLAHQLRRQRKLPLAQAELLVAQVAIGLEAARTAGIVHRDLKPHNVFFAEADGARRWKILDFGVSKVGGSGTLTQGHVVGTPAYMAPEQARGEDVDHRADVYSLAAILYRALTGHPAFTGKDVPTTLYDVVYRIPTQPSILAALPSDIDRVLALGLAKDPKDRFATATELAAWFTRAVDDMLDLEQRRRADDLLHRQPWGTRTNASS